MKLVIAIIATALTGCAQPGPKPLYQWAGYQPSVYQYLKSNGADPGAQIPALEAQIEKNRSAGQATPPGMQAHLALLYSKVGDDTSAQRYLEAERRQFPESATYVEFLLKGRKTANASAPAAAASQPNI